MYLDSSKIMSYNANFNVIIAERGIGKSYFVKKYVIDKYKKSKEMFFYIRRFQNELDKIFSKDSNDFFTDIKKSYPTASLEGKAGRFYYDNEVFGFSARLTEAQDLKSANFDNVTTIIFDEYAIEKSRRHYLTNEMHLFVSILDTIIRNRKNIKIFILGNATPDLEYSPLFSYFNLQLPTSSDFKYYKNQSILVYYSHPNFQNLERENTFIGKLTANTDYFKYAIKNEIVKNIDFIIPFPTDSKFCFAFKFQNKIYGVWINYRKGIYFISEKYDKNTSSLFAMTFEDYSPNTLLYSRLKYYKKFTCFLEAFKSNNVRFENEMVKYYSLLMIKKFISYR